jgi:hypothetical protein
VPVNVEVLEPEPQMPPLPVALMAALETVRVWAAWLMVAALVMVCAATVMSQPWTGGVTEHALAGLAASMTMSSVALTPAVDAVDLDVILRLQTTFADDEEPRIVMVHVTLVPAFDENSRVPEIDLPSAEMVPVNVDVGQVMTTPAVTVNELSVELAEIAAPGGVIVAWAGMAATANAVSMTADNRIPRVEILDICLAFLAGACRNRRFYGRSATGVELRMPPFLNTRN